MNTLATLEFNNVTLTNQTDKGHIPNGKSYHITNMNYSIQRGYITLITGDTSTDIASICTALVSKKPIYNGNIRYNGCDITDNSSMWLNRLGYISEKNIFFDDMSVDMNMQICSLIYSDFNTELFNSWMRTFAINQNTLISALSRGEFIKFQLAIAIAHNSEVLLFDEALAGLDIVFRKELLKIVSSLIDTDNIAAIFVAENISELRERADYIITFNNGVIVNADNSYNMEVL